MDELKFGTSGLRGLVVELTPEVCAAYTTAFLDHLHDDSPSGSRVLLVGRDLRGSSPAIASACLTAAVQAGYEAIDCSALPTPALALAAMRAGAPAIMVTGSHIPADRNGLKFYRPDGEVTKADETGILRWLGKPRGSTGKGAASVNLSALEAYARRYLSVPAFSLDGLTVGVYQHSSVARDLLVDLIAGLGGRPVALGPSDVFVPVDTEALRAEDIELGREWASQQPLDAIVSTDGDADRPLIADERGEFLRGDVVGILTAARLGADTVVTPVTSTSAVEASGLFRNVVRTRVGSPYVIEGMAAQGSSLVVGFEANGGVLLGSSIKRDGFEIEALPTRDAVLPMLAVLSLARAKGVSVSELAAQLPPRFTASDRLKEIPSDVSGPFLDTLVDDPARSRFLGGFANVEAVDRTDGVRLQLSGGETLHFRASGNAPELRCYAEAITPGRAAELLAWGLDRAAAELGQK